MAAYFVVCGPIWSKSEYIQDGMHFLLVCMFKKDQINSNREKMETLIFRLTRAANSQAEIQDIQAFMVVLVTCKNEEDPLKRKALEWSQHFSHCKHIGFFPDAKGQLTPLSGVRSD